MIDLDDLRGDSTHKIYYNLGTDISKVILL